MVQIREKSCRENASSAMYFLTSTLGKLVTKFLPSIEFLTNNKEYLLTHNISIASRKFIEKIGELQEHQYNAKVGLVLSFTHQY